MASAPDAPPPQPDLKTPPDAPNALHTFLRNTLGIRLARTPLVPGHQAPFDYLCHAFFEGRVFDGDDRPTDTYRSPDCIVWANRGGGKTWLGALATLLDLLFKPGIQVRILGGSLEQSRRMHAYLATLLDHEALAKVPRHIAARRITIFHPGEPARKSIVEVLAASQTSVRGTRVQKLRCDEVDLFDPEVWEAAQLVTRSMSCKGPWGENIGGSVEALSTMHKPFGLMWKLVGPKKTGERDQESSGPPRPTFRWGVLDVLEFCTPEHTCDTCILHPECQGRAKTHLTPETSGHLSIADAARQKTRVSIDTWGSEMLCLRPSRSDTVYPEFDVATHVVGDPPPGARPFSRYIGGMDFGFRSESVLLLAGVDEDGNVTVLREHARTGVIVSDFVDTLDRWLDAIPGGRKAFDFLGVDPAGNADDPQTGKANIQLFKDRRYRVKWRGSETPFGIRSVQARIAPAVAASPGAKPRLLVHHSCTRLIECLTRYHYNKDRPEDLNPVKDGHDHAPDALRYMILNLDCANKTTWEQT